MFFLLITLCNGFVFGKCLLISFKNLAPTFVLTVAQYGGLNHSTGRFLFLFLFLAVAQSGSYLSLYLYPALSNVTWLGLEYLHFYGGGAFWDYSRRRFM